GFVVCGLLMLHTHYYAVLPAVALILYTVLMRRSYPIPTRWAVGGIVSAAVFYLPWVAAIAYEQFYRNPMRLTRELPEWFRAHWWEFATVTNRFNNGKIDGLLGGSPAWAALVGSLLFSLPAVLAIWALVPGARRRTADRGKHDATLLMVVF